MIYRIRFEADPDEIQFELLQERPVTVKKVLEIVKFNFKNSTLTMDQDECIVRGRIYVINRKVRRNNENVVTFND